MPLLPLKPIIIGTSILVGASLALYESHPQLRALVDSAAIRLVDMFEDVLDVLDAQLRLLTPQQREERRRRQRERVRTAVLFDASSRQSRHNDSYAAEPDTEMQSRDHGNDSSQTVVEKASGVDMTESALSKPTMSSLAMPSDPDRRAKRRRLWEMSESALQMPRASSANDSAVDVAESSTSQQPLVADAAKDSANDAPPPYQPPDELHSINDAASDISSTSSFEAINTPTSDSPSILQSRPPSVTPLDLEDERGYWNSRLTSETLEGDNGGDDDARTETMSHVSGYSFGSYANNEGGNQSEAESWDNADVISVASSSTHSGDLNTAPES